MNNPIEEIQEMIEYYESIYDKISIDQAMRFQDKLSVYSFYLADELAGYKQQYNDFHILRKLEFNRKKQALISKESYPVSKAEAEANTTELFEKYYKRESEFESVGYRLDLLLKQVNRILSSVQQRVSYLKLEFDKSKTQV